MLPMRDERTTNKQTLKIELLSQWKLEAEFRNFPKLNIQTMLKGHPNANNDSIILLESSYICCIGGTTLTVWICAIIPGNTSHTALQI